MSSEADIVDAGAECTACTLQSRRSFLRGGALVSVVASMAAVGLSSRKPDASNSIIVTVDGTLRSDQDAAAWATATLKV